jgi:hypothetical protein
MKVGLVNLGPNRLSTHLRERCMSRAIPIINYKDQAK